MSPTPPPPETGRPDASEPVLPEHWRGLVDDAAVFPPGDADLHDALATYDVRRAQWWSGLVGSFVVTDTDLGSVPAGVPVSVVLTTGAGAVEGVVSLAARKGLTLAGLEVAVRDAADPVGNVRRIDAAARAAGVAVPLFIEVPGPATASWLSAVDEVAACDHRLKLRLGNVDHDLVPDAGTVATWIDAALDRELRFKATAGLHRAVRHEPEGGGAHGFLNVLGATAALWDGGSTTDAVAVLEQRDGAALTDIDVAAARRWFTSFGSCSVTEPLDDLISLGLIEKVVDTQ